MYTLPLEGKRAGQSLVCFEPCRPSPTGLHIQTDAHTVLNTVAVRVSRLLYPPNTHLVFSSAVAVSIRPRMHRVTETFFFCMVSSWRSEVKNPSSANLEAE